MKILRDVSNGNTKQASERNRTSESQVRRVLARYADIAEGILAEDRRKAMDFDKEV